MTLLKGADVVAAMKEKMLARTEILAKAGITPKLVIIRVGAREDDMAYERGALKRMESVGITAEVEALDAQADTEAVVAVVRRLADDASVHGILIFRPLPAHIDGEAVKAAMPPQKDIDCMTSSNMAALFEGTGTGFPPCTPAAVIELINHFGIGLSGRRVTLVGRSLVVGKPLAMLLIANHATVTVCHTRTKELAARCREADIIIAAAGSAKMIGADSVRNGQVIIDVGINIDDEGNLCGDADAQSLSQLDISLTPVPGGVGTVTTSVLASHVISAAEKSAK